ncbi:Short-chain-enoyl-CoA hydratase [bacterium HR30]|nr:Short-chain-enoyl-CoA hydratase [bacterium HR30]
MAVLSFQNDAGGGYIDATIDSQLCHAIEEIVFDDSVRVVVLCSGGREFCLGLADGENTPWRLRSIEALAHLSCPVIAVVDGGAVAEGCELALACDLRFASTRASFALPQLLQGRFPQNGATQRLPRLVGRMRALDMLWRGRRVSAREALRWGLVNAVYPPQRLALEVERYAELLAQRAPIALRYVKEAVLQGLDCTLDQGMRLEEDLYVLLQTTADFRAGLEAFRRRKIARFRGE